MSKGVFDQSIEDMLELDRSLDINSMLNDLPALETEEKKEESVEKEDKTEEKEVKLDINKVLDKPVEKEEDEEEDVKEKDEKAPATNESSSDEKSSDAPFTVIFAKDLVKQGLLSSFNEEEFNKSIKEIGEADTLRNLIRDEIEANIEAAKSDLDLGYKEFLALTGKGVPAESAGSLIELKTRFESIKLEDLTNEDNVELRRKVMTDYFKLTTSMSDAKIDKLVQSSIDLGDDIDDSKEYLASLKTAIKEQIAEEEAEAANQLALKEDEKKRVLNSLKETINTMDDVIPGVSINKQIKTKMYDHLTKEVTDSKGRITNSLWAKRAEDPIYFDSKLAYLLETGFFEKGKPWNKAGQAKVTKEITSLESALESKKNTKTSLGSPVISNLEQDKTSKDNIDSMRGIFGR